MNIDELEYIRDFQCNIDTIKDHLSKLIYEIDDDMEDNYLTQNTPQIVKSYLLVLLDSLNLVHENFKDFKEKMDLKYISVWREEYPNIKIMTRREISRKNCK